MKIFRFIVIIFLIGCSNQDKDVEEILIDDEIGTEINSEMMDFSDRYKSKGSDLPIWENSSDLQIEDYIEIVDIKEFTIAGKKFTILNSENIANNLNLVTNDKLTSDYIKVLNSKDDKIIAIVQQMKITSVNFRKEADLQLSGNNIFDLSFEAYKDKFPGSYSVRNLKPNISDVSYYYNIDSVETLDFTQLNSQECKLNFTWVNGYLKEVEYSIIEK
ncbi:hypothetical protein [Algoriphagus persicinus]|uniref:hypothetical protein n=1 Tax=Algoriphagus persicinus TaxID=3108754 RepID=UPI002B3FF996|nr:hypothetical protein [Algoriphagus sp. E1-3-M2]MEB2787364.1 hypothetical protein [Algoriphagus sp. E1-3-M2]